MDIETLARRVAGELLETVPGLSTTSPIERGMKIYEVLNRPNGAGADLVSAFNADASFGNLRSGWIQQAGGFGMMVGGHAIPHRMVDSIVVGQFSNSFVKDAREFAASPTCATISYAPVAGAIVTETVDLGDGLILVPWSDVPAVDQRKVFDFEASLDALLSPIPIIPTFRPAANMAVRNRSAECQVLFPSSQDAEKVRKANSTASSQQSARIADVLRCIALQGESVVAQLGNWAMFDNQVANNLIGVSYSFTSALSDHSLYAASQNPIRLDAKSLTRLFGCFEALKPPTKDPLRISIDRFCQAMRRADVVDRAIDLGIALEVMLLHSIGSKERGELRYRSSIRGAMFLGGDKRERLATFKLLKDAYDPRSKAVHAGVLTEKKNQLPPAETLKQAAAVCARIARRLIERGAFPDWDVEYVIGQ